MRDRIVSAYCLTPAEDALLTAFGSLSIPEIATRLGAEPSTVSRQLTALAKKLDLPMEKVRLLAQWLHTGSCPIASESPSMWKCLDRPFGCGEIQPIANFDLWPVDQRCVRCVAAAVERSRKQSQRLAVMNVLRQTVGSIKGNKMDLPHIEDTLSRIYDLEGGPEMFARNWHDQLVHARTGKPGSKYVLDAYRDLARLTLAVQQSHTPDFAKMSEDELKSFLADQVLIELAKRGKDHLLELYDGEEHQMVEDMKAAEDGATQ